MKPDLMKECVKAISIMINRFDTTLHILFKSADDIVDYLEELDSIVPSLIFELDPVQEHL
jgi:hypothetical protein